MCPPNVQKLTFALMLVSILLMRAAVADDSVRVDRNRVKIAAVQISGYDKGDLPRKDFTPTKSFLPYIDRAGRDGAELIVFPEYVLGRIQVPGQETAKIGASAKANSIYVIVGCWELVQDGTFANTALIFDRSGEIVGKYRKTHAAVDHFDPGDSPWSRPPADKSKDWMIANDPEWIMKAGQALP
jgi:predicted amidohydrolase